MIIRRIDAGPRMSQAVVYENTIYVSGQVAAPGEDIATQTRAVLERIETLLGEAGSSKSKLISATIWLADMADFEAMNRVWDAWVETANAPARATGEARLATADYKVEIVVVAAT